MIRVNFNRFVNLLLITLSLIIIGCTEAPKLPLNLSQEPPVKPTQNNEAVNQHTYKFNKTASNHKNTVWERLISLYSLPEIDNPRINRELYWYLEHPTSLAIIQQRAEPYLNHILDEIEARNMPGELALLPVVESAFVPDAYSKADASGLWQFVPSTGREYGLEQNDWYDGRRDIFDSTRAATNYLKELSEDFNGDWLLALASYNCGKGRVRKSIDKNTNLNLPTDYWSLDLPEETEDYVPRLLAIARIFAHADEYNIHLQHIPNRPYFEVVDIQSPLDLHKAAELANTPLHTFLKLNPGFNRKSTAPQGPHRLLVPVAHAQTFKENLALLPPSERVTPIQYEEDRADEPVRQEKHQEPNTPVNDKTAKAAINNSNTKTKPTENLVANAKNVPTKQNAEKNKSPESNAKGKATETIVAATKYSEIATHLSRTNNKISAINVNDEILKPKNNTGKPQSTHDNKSIPKAAVVALAESKQLKAKTSDSQSYEIKKGDTFYNISQRFSVTPKDLASWNNITINTALLPGKKLTIKSLSSPFVTAPAVHMISYTVGKNESLTQICKKFKVSEAELRKTNASTLVKGLSPGQKLKISVENS